MARFTALIFPGRFFEGPANGLRAVLRRLSDPYRPELHYMRGPGPKWREKHGQAFSPALGRDGAPDRLQPGLDYSTS